jgi:8-oxo-dGTP pyrophosphatase MutT (NUDIX family)
MTFEIKNDSNVDTGRLVEDMRYLEWLTKFQNHGNLIKSVRFAGAVETADSIYSIFLEVEFEREGLSFTRSLMLRGPAVAIIPIIIGASLYESNFVTVKQPRICTGQVTNEFPSGGACSASLSESAVRELSEETGIRSDQDRLILLRRDLIVCESAFDEIVSWFLIELEPDECNVGYFGVQKEGEFIETELLSWRKLGSINTFHMLVARQLLEEYYSKRKKVSS